MRSRVFNFQSLIFNKIKSFWKEPKVVVAVSGNQEMTKKIISQILGHSFKIEKEVLFINSLEKRDLSARKYLILNFDDNSIQKPEGETLFKVLTFGFQEGADFWATDIKKNGGTNFKLNYRGSIIPIWLDGTFNQKEIYSILAAIVVGTVFGLNLVGISQSLTSVPPLEMTV